MNRIDLPLRTFGKPEVTSRGEEKTPTPIVVGGPRPYVDARTVL